ncbi:tyrosine-type recombinase/integrase [Listeria booriae]|uniref:site-specific integrase n=1 Tax=Listeria booriae TaxID=1552123 RepID=UPI001629C4DA|nr:tyrosine-type recombinase/integrase [Listeria booriae]MBC2368138.1 tyrosine-type recombinase/integrase [Listeria booriae]
MGLQVKYNKKYKKWLWRARVRIAGNQEELSGRAASKNEATEVGAIAFTKLMNKKKNEAQALDSNVSLENFMEEWFVTYRENELLDNTTQNRRGFMENHIYPAMGHMPLKDINRLFYQKFINSLAKKDTNGKPKLASGSIKILNSIVNACMEYACYDLRIIDYNPCIKIKIPQTKTVFEIQQDELNKFYSETEILTLMADNEELDIIYEAIHIFTNTGIRLGEFIGLLEDAYFQEDKYLLIDKQLKSKSTKKNPIFGAPKTMLSSRIVYLDDETDAIIRKRIQKNKEFRFAHPEFKQKYNFIFNTHGYPLLQNYVRSCLARICKRTNIPYHTNHPIHAFRHTHVKRLDEAGLTETAIQQRIGHTKGSKITRAYTHMDEALNLQTIDIYSSYKKAKDF